MENTKQLEERIEQLEENFNQLMERLTEAGIRKKINFDDLIIEDYDIEELDDENEEEII